MKRITIQFWIRHRGYQDIVRVVSPGDKADDIAKTAIAGALHMFNKRWRGARKDELTCVGIRDNDTKREVTHV